MKQDSNHFVGLDIGTTKICAVVVRKNDDGTVDVIGLGSCPSTGIRKGVVINIDATVKAISSAIEEAQRMSGVEIKTVCAGIAGGHIKSFNSRGIIAVKNKEVTEKDIERVLESASAVDIPIGSEALHVLPQQYILDGQSEIKDPLGMSGSRLEVSVHIIAIQKSGLENIKKTISHAGLEIENLVSTPYASGLAVLKDDEKELGVALIDIGATTSDLGIFINKSLRHTDTLGVGSHHITNDLSIALHTPLIEAEYIKLNFGELIERDKKYIEFSVIGNEKENQKVLIDAITQIILLRIEETFLLLKKEIENSGLKEQIGAGVVLTGGFTNFYNIASIASKYFDNFPIRIGYPKEIDGLFEDLKKPEFACIIGLLLYGIREGINYEIDSNHKFIAKNYKIEKAQEDKKEVEEETKDILDPITTNETPNLLQKFRTWISSLF